MRMNRKAGMTLEAAVLIPLFLFLMVTVTDLGIDLYQEVSTQKEQEVLENLWMVDVFYRLKNGEELIEALKGQ